MKKFLSLVVITALLVSAMSFTSVFAAKDPSWIWYPADDGDAQGFSSCTEDVDPDGKYVSFHTLPDQPEGCIYPGSTVDMSNLANGNLASSNMGLIETAKAKYALIKYRSHSSSEDFGEYMWNDGTDINNNGFKTFSYKNDGEWHFSLTDIANASYGTPWPEDSEIGWFRIDFSNKVDDNSKAYTVDIEYVALFETEADAKAFAEADGGATFPDENADSNNDDNDDNNDNNNDNDSQGGEQTVPPTGDIAIITLAAAAIMILTVAAKRKFSGTEN